MKNIQHMKLYHYIGLTLSLLAGYLPAAVNAKQVVELNQIIAVVNNDIITRLELDRRIFLVRQQLKENKTKLPPRKILEKQVLEQLIMEMVQVQHAKRRGIRINDETINRVIENIAKENKLTISQFRKVLAKDGMRFAEFRENMKNQMMSEQLRKAEIERKISVTPQEVSNYLARAAKSGGGKTEYHLLHILIGIPEGASPEQIKQVRQTSRATLEKLRKGDDFRQTAIAVSNGQNALRGGDLGWLKAAQLPTAFADQVLGMKPGETSAPIRSPSGFHIIRLEGTRSNNKKRKINQTMARHILIQTNQLVSDAEAKQRLKKLRSRILAGEDFAKLARVHSDDKASGADGGSLGWVSPGKMVPEFTKEMDATKQGEISKPFRSRFGWHLVQVMSRRKHDNSQEYERLQAHRQIHQRKANEATEIWFRQIRNEAYVEYRLNN